MDSSAEPAVLDLVVYCYGCDKRYHVRVEEAGSSQAGLSWHTLCPASPGFSGSTGVVGQEGHTTVTASAKLVSERGTETWKAWGRPLTKPDGVDDDDWDA